MWVQLRKLRSCGLFETLIRSVIGARYSIRFNADFRQGSIIQISKLFVHAPGGKWGNSKLLSGDCVATFRRSSEFNLSPVHITTDTFQMLLLSLDPDVEYFTKKLQTACETL